MIKAMTALSAQLLAEKVDEEMDKGDTVQFISERLAFIIKGATKNGSKTRKPLISKKTNNRD